MPSFRAKGGFEMSSSEIHPWVAEVLSRELDHWDMPNSHPSETKHLPILRLEILKRIARQVHSLRSQCLASGKRDDLPTLKHWEESIEKMAKLTRLDQDFYSLFNGLGKLPERSRIVPESIFKHIAREKLVRYDRTWEYHLAAEGCKLGWIFWSLISLVSIHEIEQWDEQLRTLLWPKGLILFSEPAPGPLTGPQENTWSGQWIVLTAPNLSRSDLLMELLAPIKNGITIKPLF